MLMEQVAEEAAIEDAKEDAILWKYEKQIWCCCFDNWLYLGHTFVRPKGYLTFAMPLIPLTHHRF